MTTYKVGIDCGTITGIAVVENGKLVVIEQMGILEATSFVLALKEWGDVLLYVENPNTNNGGGYKDKGERAQGAGSIKRDYSIWEEFSVLYELPLNPISVKTVGHFNFENNIEHFLRQVPNALEIQPKIKQKGYKHAREAVACVYVHIKD